MAIPHPSTSKPLRIALWTLQGLLAALFLFTGGIKLVMPIATLARDTSLPELFIRFIGVLEVIGALGLVLPGLLQRRAALTPLAALGLVIIMSGALGVSLTTGHADTAAIPIVVGIGLAIVAVVRGMLLQPPRA